MDNDVLKPGKNCWRIEKASYASIIVDYANYYRDLHKSICKAKESLFILGWDIDGRIELLRGKDKENCPAPSCLFELIKWKMEQNPDFKVYLNKWDYSIFFAKEREPLAGLHWHTIKSENFHYCVDGVLPLGACHHQKIAVIDDEVAYCGGMDIALARWDFREHHVNNPDRKDPSDLFHPDHHIAFTPYHDLMMVTAGDAARALAQLVRNRWTLASSERPIPLFPKTASALPFSWPDSDPPDFENVDIAIARTLPPVKANSRVEEIIWAYIAEIAEAEKFIYIENQFLVQKDIARAINKRLRERPALRVLAISCDHPKGVMERKSMWAPRLDFRTIVECGNVADRVALAHPVSREDGREDPVRIHSKLMIIDDKFLHLGSANINNRSMGMDTECDQIIIGKDKKSRVKIAAVRTDLIREHSGREADEIERLIDTGAPIQAFLDEVPMSRQHLKRINDKPYRNEKFVALAKMVSDPRRPLITANLTIPVSSKYFKKHISKPYVWIVLFILLLAGAFYFEKTMGAGLFSLSNVTAWLEDISESPFAIPLILGLFILSGIIFFPITIMIAGTSAAYGPVSGFLLSMAGTLLSAAVGYMIGRRIGFPTVKSVFGKNSQKIRDAVNHSGVTGVTIIRMLPIAPFGIMNILYGINAIPFSSYIIGSFLGSLPGTLALAFLGNSLFQVFKNPDPKNITYLITGFAAWIGVIALSHFMERKLHREGGAI